jgi:hypothetical protein
MRSRSPFALALAVAMLTALVARSAALSERSPDGLLPLEAMGAPSEPTGKSSVASRRGLGDVLFIENVGQFVDAARFYAWGGGSGLWLTNDAMCMTLVEHTGTILHGVHIHFSFVGRNPDARLEPIHRLDTRVSYLIDSDPTGWRTEVPVWGGVRYKDLYPGIDLEFRADQGRLAQYLVAQDAADLAAVRLRVEGADELAVRDGALHLTTAAGRWSMPLFTLVMDGDVDVALALQPELDGNEVVAPFGVRGTTGTSLSSSGAADGSDLFFSTFVGGDTEDTGVDLVVDDQGAVYLCGITASEDFPATPGAFEVTYQGGGLNEYVQGDAFIAKVDATGESLLYATFLGGSSGAEIVFDIAVDDAGNAYLAGSTESDDFPVTSGAPQPVFQGGDEDGYLAKLNASGSELVFATFLGGVEKDSVAGIAVAEDGSIYITGRTESVGFPTTLDSFQPSLSGGQDGYVAKLDPTGSTLLYSTFLGGERDDEGYAIALDDLGNAYVVGNTASSDFPVSEDAFSGIYNGGISDGFAAKLDPTGSSLVYATFLGGERIEACDDVVLDSSGNLYVIGKTESPDFPVTPGAFMETHGGVADAFVVEINETGSELVYSTFVGGSDVDNGHAIALDIIGQIHITGRTASANFPTTRDAYDRTFAGLGEVPQWAGDAFVVKLNPAAGGPADLLYSTFIGGSSGDGGLGVAVHHSGITYVVGRTMSGNFPTTEGAFDRVFNGGGWYADAFVAKLRQGELPPPTPTPTPTNTPTPTPTPSPTPTSTLTPTVIPTETPTPTVPPSAGAIVVCVWEDADGDGERDAEEEALSGAYIEVRDGQGQTVDSCTVDLTGCCRVSDLEPGSYTVHAEALPGFVLTTAGSVSVEVLGGQISEVYFGMRAWYWQFLPAIKKGVP